MRRTLLCLLLGAGAQAWAGGTPEPDLAPAAGVAAQAEPAEPATGASPAPPPAPATPARIDPSARLPAGKDAAEHWDLAAHFASGHRLYARFLLTNAGPGERSAAAHGHWIDPDGRAHEFRNGRLAGRWELSEDRRRIRIGSSVLSFAGAQRHFEVDNDKRGIELRLDFPDDGSGHAGPRRPDGYRAQLLNLATPARGSFWREGMRAPVLVEGRVLLTHTWFPGPEGDHVLRRLDAATLGPCPRLFVSRVEPPRGEAWQWAVGGVEGRLEGLEGVILEGAVGAGSEYPVPERLTLRGKGISGDLKLGSPVLQLDPLAALPTLVRMVYSFGRRPRHVWADSTAEVVLKSPASDAVLRVEGAGIATLFFLDASPPSQR